MDLKNYISEYFWETEMVPRVFEAESRSGSPTEFTKVIQAFFIYI